MNDYIDVLYLFEKNGFAHFFLSGPSLYAECSHFLPYTTPVVNKRLCET